MTGNIFTVLMKKKSLILKLFLSIIIIAVFILFVPAINVLSICERKSPSKKFYSKEGYQNGFYISYTHSVNKGRVHDFYSCNANSLLMDKTIFVSYGAGIPEAAETPGAIFTVLKNRYEITNIQRKVNVLTMAVGLIANHTIAFGSDLDDSKEIAFSKYFKPQTSILIKTEKISLWNYMFCKKINTI